MTTVRALRRPFPLAVPILWGVLVAMPLLLSLVTGMPAAGIPLVGVVLWFGAVRLGRVLSPAARADRLIQRGRYAEAVALCDAALAVNGRGQWIGARRLGWLNRRTLSLLAAGQFGHAVPLRLKIPNCITTGMRAGGGRSPDRATAGPYSGF